MHDGKTVYSYGTPVARVEGETLQQLGYWSVTTQKHINYAAEQLGLKLRKPINP
tara:strand:- start:184 stop:345 length:162 start_codon:yes stop_codon:yes gene_type:complete